jgi:hypothetical protein
MQGPSSFVAGVVAMVAAGGCFADERVPADPGVTTVTAAFSSGPCPPAGCSTNSPVIDTLVGFHDLSLVGDGSNGMATVLDDAGLAIVAAGEARRAQIVQKGQSYDLSILDGRIVGSCGPWCTPLEGPDLVGATITLTYGPKPAYVITIETVRKMGFFLGGGSTEAYTLTWTSLGGGPSTNVCNNVKLLEQLLGDQAGDESYAAQELMGMQPWETVVFEGDRIDETRKTMKKTADDTWFNVACAGNLLAKLRLTRNTIHGQSPGLSDAWEQRQATMKMLAADYCGTGAGLTVAGQRLVWKGDLMTDFYRRPDVIEARWTERGATCLYAPRMLFPTSQLGAATFPDIRDAIRTACAAGGRRVPPKCATLDPDDYDGALRVSANPK